MKSTHQLYTQTVRNAIRERLHQLRVLGPWRADLPRPLADALDLTVRRALEERDAYEERLEEATEPGAGPWVH